MGAALLQQVPNPFYGNSAFGNLSVSPTISRGQLLRPFPQFDNVLAHRVNQARARYNALTLRWDRRVQRNWGVNVNYTFSRLKDNQFGEANQYANRQGSAVNNHDLDAEYGYSLLDVPHRLNVSGTVILPFGEGHRWLQERLAGALLGGWSVTAAGRIRTAFRSASGSRATTPDCWAATSGRTSSRRADLATSGSWEDRLTAWINSAAFSPPRRSRSAMRRARCPISAPRARPTLTCRSRSRSALAARPYRLRADVLNLFDNPLFTAPTTTFGTPTFGQVASVGGFARSVQFQVRVGW